MEKRECETGQIVEIIEHFTPYTTMIYMDVEGVERLNGAPYGEKWEVMEIGVSASSPILDGMKNNIFLQNKDNSKVWAIVKANYLKLPIDEQIKKLKNSKKKWQSIVDSINDIGEALEIECDYCKVFEGFYLNRDEGEECPLKNSCEACRSQSGKERERGYNKFVDSIKEARSISRQILEEIEKDINRRFPDKKDLNEKEAEQ